MARATLSSWLNQLMSGSPSSNNKKSRSPTEFRVCGPLNRPRKRKLDTRRKILAGACVLGPRRQGPYRRATPQRNTRCLPYQTPGPGTVRPGPKGGFVMSDQETDAIQEELEPTPLAEFLEGTAPGNVTSVTDLAKQQRNPATGAYIASYEFVAPEYSFTAEVIRATAQCSSGERRCPQTSRSRSGTTLCQLPVFQLSKNRKNILAGGVFGQRRLHLRYLLQVWGITHVRTSDGLSTDQADRS